MFIALLLWDKKFVLTTVMIPKKNIRTLRKYGGPKTISFIFRGDSLLLQLVIPATRALAAPLQIGYCDFVGYTVSYGTSIRCLICSSHN